MITDEIFKQLKVFVILIVMAKRAHRPHSTALQSQKKPGVLPLDGQTPYFDRYARVPRYPFGPYTDCFFYGIIINEALILVRGLI